MLRSDKWRRRPLSGGRLRIAHICVFVVILIPWFNVNIFNFNASRILDELLGNLRFTELHPSAAVYDVQSSHEVAVKFCGDRKWKDTSISCDKRVRYLIGKYHMTLKEAQQSVLENCICGGSGRLASQSAQPKISHHQKATRDSTSLPTNTKPPVEKLWLLASKTHPPSSIGIPHLVHKILLQKDGLLPNELKGGLKEAHESWKTFNPGYSWRYYDLVTAREYLLHFFHPVFLRTFDCLQAFAFKADLLRMAILYREGGYYSDWKQKCLKQNLLNDISNETDFFAAHDWGNAGSKRKKCVSNAFVGARPRHPVIAKTIKIIMANVQCMNGGKNSLETSGPCAFGRAFLEGNTTILGYYSSDMYYTWKDERIVLHKCTNCSIGQDWEKGNNYDIMWTERQLFCQDAPAIFLEG